MPTVDLLTQRLKDIAKSLETGRKAQALLGLGSAGLESNRMDCYSDLDFFVITYPGYKSDLLDDLSWLKNIAPEGYSFRNTVDGYKFLYADGVFCEFAVFEAHELAHIPYSSGQIIWAAPEFDPEIVQPKTRQGHYERSSDIEWILGEALTNLYVGLGRFQRGEALSAFRFVQSFALDRLLDLMHIKNEQRSGQVDPFVPDRRLEQHMPSLPPLLTQFCQGYEQTPASALAQLEWLEANFTVNRVIAREIRALA